MSENYTDDNGHKVSWRDYVDMRILNLEKATEFARMGIDRRLECVSVNTPILCADLTWRAAGDLKPGIELIGIDEESPSDGTKRGRRFRRSTVTSNVIKEDSLVLVKTPKGEVQCNKNHPWLVLRHKMRGDWEWVSTIDLKQGDTVKYIVKPWLVDPSWEAGWLAGIYDGEGCMSFKKDGSVQLSIGQRESETAERINKILTEKTNGDSFGRYKVKRRLPWKPFAHFIIGNRASVLRMIGSIRPPRLLVNSDKIWENNPISGNYKDTTILSVEDIGRGMIASLSTSTKTYIANGFAMHNSMNEFRDALKDATARNITRTEVEAMMSRINEDVKLLRADMFRKEGEAHKKEQTETRGGDNRSYILAIVSLILWAITTGIMVILKLGI
jgi:hypothetical protein